METGYLLDTQLRIRAVSGDWDAFARRTGGSTLARQVMGREIWAFIHDLDTAAYLNAIFFTARQSGQPVESLCRCDGPDWLRIFRQQVTPTPEGGFCIRHVQLAARPVNTAPPPGEAALRCSICCRAQVAGQWRDGAPPGPARAYTVCPCCKARARATLGPA